MKVTVVYGSPREEGLSAEVAGRIAQEMAAAGADVVEYNINQMDIAGCKACMACKKGAECCVVKDDFAEYYKDMKDSDVLIVTAPNYFAQINGPMVTFMNRHYCLIDGEHNLKLPKGKKVFGVFSQGAPESYDYSSAYDWYLGCFARLGFENLGYITLGGDSDISEESELIKKAIETADKLGA